MDQELFARFRSPQADQLYDEAITELEHGLQCAALARRDGASDAEVAAALLHDVGHGPFSHALEHSLVRGVHHEEVSTLIMTRLNEELNGMLDTGIEIFNDHHPKPFLHQLVSSQLDMDRLDYLARDSFYSGVTEGKVGSDKSVSSCGEHQ